MVGEKLISLLSGFSKYELNRLRKFLRSPYFNEQLKVTELFEICNGALRRGGPAELENLRKTEIWSGLFSSQPYDDPALRRLISDLTQLILKFMAMERREQQPHREWLEQHELLGSPDLQKHRIGVERLFDRYWEHRPDRPIEYYFTNYQKAWNNFTNASKTMVGASYLDHLLKADYYLDCYYFIQKLKLYAAWLIFRNLRTSTEELPVHTSLWEQLDDPRFKAVPLIAISVAAIRCLSEPDEEQHFRSLIEGLEFHAAQLSSEDRRISYQLAQNYCAFKINQGKTAYYREVFEIFRKIIDQGILLEDGQLPEAMYKNIITVSLGVGEYDFAEDFINKYTEFLPAKIRENARSYNLSNLYFHQKKYAQVIELLRNVEYSDVVYVLGAKLMLLRTYYECDEFMALDSFLESFRIYLRRNQALSKDLKREYGNFLTFLKRLSSFNNTTPIALEALHKRVVECQYVAYKKWLVEKITELKKEKSGA